MMIIIPAMMSCIRNESGEISRRQHISRHPCCHVRQRLSGAFLQSLTDLLPFLSHKTHVSTDEKYTSVK